MHTTYSTTNNRHSHYNFHSFSQVSRIRANLLLRFFANGFQKEIFKNILYGKSNVQVFMYTSCSIDFLNIKPSKFYFWRLLWDYLPCDTWDNNSIYACVSIQNSLNPLFIVNTLAHFIMKLPIQRYQNKPGQQVKTSIQAIY